MPKHLSLAFPNLQNGEHRSKSLHYARHQVILTRGVDLCVHFTAEAIAPALLPPVLRPSLVSYLW